MVRYRQFLTLQASWGAGQIGGMYSKEALNYGVHKALHGVVGAGLGASIAAISHQDPRLGAVSGAFGAVMSEVIAEEFALKTADITQYQKDRPDQKPEDVRSHFMEKAQRTTNWAAFASAVGAFGLGMDVTSAHAAARNAVDNNFLHMIFWTVAAATLVEYPQYIRDLKTEEAHVALGKMGIRVAEGTAIGLATGGVLGKVFEVGGRIVYSLREALSLAKASTPVMTSEVAQLFTQFEKNAPEVEQLVKALRPTARQSEVDIGVMLGDGYKPQISFKDSSQIRYGSKGSTRPDLISQDLTHCIEVKNYVVSSESGISRLVSDISNQALKRQAQLPVGMQQHVFIDVRGQTVSGIQRKQIIDQIAEKTGSLIKKSSIRFME